MRPAVSSTATVSGSSPDFGEAVAPVNISTGTAALAQPRINPLLEEGADFGPTVGAAVTRAGQAVVLARGLAARYDQGKRIREELRAERNWPDVAAALE